MTNIPVNWETYLDVFPDRYIKPGLFDAFIEQAISSFGDTTINALDVGGGVLGTQALNKPSVQAWLADPFVSTCPNWMKQNLSRTPSTVSLYLLPEITRERFDLIVARGSFNYLETPDIYGIGELLKPDGIFIFNTFVLPQTGERPYVNSKTNQTGIEKYFHEGSKIRHQLILNSGTTIEHSFYVYSVERIEFMLAGADLFLAYETHNNSLYGTAYKTSQLRDS